MDGKWEVFVEQFLCFASSFDVQLLKLKPEVNLDFLSMSIRLMSHAWSYRQRYRRGGRRA